MSIAVAAVAAVSLNGCGQSYPVDSLAYQQLQQAASGIYSATHDGLVSQYFEISMEKNGVSTYRLNKIASSVTGEYQSGSYQFCAQLFLQKSFKEAVSKMTPSQQKRVCPEENAIFAVNEAIFDGSVSSKVLSKQNTDTFNNEPPEQALASLESSESIMHIIFKPTSSPILNAMIDIAEGLAALVTGIGLLEWRYRRSLKAD